MQHDRPEPVYQTGSYRAWEVGGADQIGEIVWHCRVDHARPEAHRLLPFSEPSIVVRRRFDEDDRTLDCRLMICPSQPDGGQYAPVPGEEQFAVQLTPELMEPALGLRAAEFAGAECDIPLSMRSAFDPALRAASNGFAREAIHGLLGALAKVGTRKAKDRVGHATHILRTAPGRFDLNRLAETVDVSPRHLRREFGNRFGMSPRAMARRMRLTSAMLEAERTLRPNWAGIAAGHGFSDQSHLIRECQEILGETPRSIHAQRLSMAVFFNT